VEALIGSCSCRRDGLEQVKACAHAWSGGGARGASVKVGTALHLNTLKLIERIM
jgi:hypothetical protein